MTGVFFCSLSCWLHGWSAWIPGCTTVAAISAAIETCVHKIYWWNFLLENIGNWRFWCWCLQCRWSSIYFDSVAHSMCFCLFSPLNRSRRGKKVLYSPRIKDERTIFILLMCRVQMKIHSLLYLMVCAFSAQGWRMKGHYLFCWCIGGRWSSIASCSTLKESNHWISR